ncbi:hypothetical protein [Pseudomonas phage LUZ7]|uniref:Uncharacterized protein n=1 Tax=Pseudomonas phage LUZ7 TaxID=655097 RepID=C8ZKE2_9CAUD|nr:hypothetical protein PP-LUZ7_gp048 [Pseudomonas phage LUZ7]CAZ66189.1 hypothetical protein [Pseudomonas phage LUZ7]
MSYWEIYLVLGVLWFLYEIADLMGNPPQLVKFVKVSPAKRLVMIFMNFGLCIFIWPLLFLVEVGVLLYLKFRSR